MPFYKNKAQKVPVFAVDANGLAKGGDTANITAKISIDGADPATTNDANPAAIDATDMLGIYLFDLLAAETNGDCIILFPVSATAGVYLRPVVLYTEIMRISGVVEDHANNSTLQFQTDLAEATNDHYKDAFVLFTSGALINQCKKITSYTGADGTIECEALTEEPTAADTFVIINR